MLCAAIKPDGTRCQRPATHGEHCYSHAPEFAEQRKRVARRGGKAGGNGRGGVSEMADIKRELRAVIAGTLHERLDKGAAATAIQGYNVLLRTVEVERKVKETEELEERIRELERSEPQTNGRAHTWR